MNIRRIKNITKKDQDGLGLVYEVNGNELEIQISRDICGVWDIWNTTEENVDEILLQVIRREANYYDTNDTRVVKMEISWHDEDKATSKTTLLRKGKREQKERVIEK